MSKSKSSSGNSSSIGFDIISWLLFIFIISFILIFIVFLVAPDKYQEILQKANEFAVMVLYGIFAIVVFVGSFIMEFTNALHITNFNVQHWRDLAVANTTKIIEFLRSIFPF